jgi:hypothetical protein
MNWKVLAQVCVGLLLYAFAFLVHRVESGEPPREVLSDSQIAAKIFDRARAFRPEKTPLHCEFGVDVPHVHVVQIDEAKETYTIDFYAWVRWEDSRLRFNTEEFGPDEIHIDPLFAWKNDRLWNPHLEFINVVETRLANRILLIKSDGTCEYQTRQTGTFKFGAESKGFKQFPFDQQELRITIGSFVWKAEQVQFRLDGDTLKSEERSERPKEGPAEEWEFVKTKHKSYNESYTGETGSFSELSVIFELKRRPGFYLWRICLPLLILVGIAISVLWMPAHHPEARMILSVTTLVAVTTFSIVVNAALPRLPYLTFLDVWMLVSFVLTALGTIENVYVADKVHHKKELAAEKMDRVCRPIVIWVYLIGSLLCAAVYGVISVQAFIIITAALCTAAAAVWRFRGVDRRDS